MIGERSLYTKQLLRNYKQRNSANVYVVNYRFANDDKERYRLFGHNEGIDFAIQYIKDLEDKIDNLQYIEKIIQVANREAIKE